MLRRPLATDGPAVTRLVGACPPLDPNSAYCNLLQCTHFADTCVIAEQNGDTAGWVSGYRPPSDPHALFIWQVAVSPAARGMGLAGRMIEALLERPAVRSATHLLTTVTGDNGPSWALFEGLAARWGAPLHRRPLFECDTHFAGAHPTEWEARIGPLAR